MCLPDRRRAGSSPAEGVAAHQQAREGVVGQIRGAVGAAEAPSQPSDEPLMVAAIEVADGGEVEGLGVLHGQTAEWEWDASGGGRDGRGASVQHSPNDQMIMRIIRIKVLSLTGEGLSPPSPCRPVPMEFPMSASTPPVAE